MDIAVAGQINKVSSAIVVIVISMTISINTLANKFPEKDCYSILGVLRNATKSEVKKAYRLKAHRAHPDRNGNSDESKQIFQEIGHAYSILKDPEKRATYDRLGSSFNAQSLRSQQANAAEDLYWVLAVKPDASNSEIKQAYNQKLNELGIKVGESGILMAPQGRGYVAATDAYNILQDPELRELYDFRSNLIERTFLGGLENHRNSEFDDIANSPERLKALLETQETRQSLDYLIYRLLYFPHRLFAIEKAKIFELVQEYVKTDRKYNSVLFADDLRYVKRQVFMRWLISPISNDYRELVVEGLRASPQSELFDAFGRSHWVGRPGAVAMIIEGNYGIGERRQLDYSSISHFEQLVNRHPHLAADPDLIYILEQINKRRGSSLRFFLSSLIKNPKFTALPNAGSILRVWRQKLPQISEWSWDGAFDIPVVKESLARDARLTDAPKTISF